MLGAVLPPGAVLPQVTLLDGTSIGLLPKSANSSNSLRKFNRLKLITHMIISLKPLPTNFVEIFVSFDDLSNPMFAQQNLYVLYSMMYFFVLLSGMSS